MPASHIVHSAVAAHTQGSSNTASSGLMAGGKKKLGQILIKLVSQAGTGYFYVTKKNPRNVPYKLQRVKYDPVVNRRVLFSESKMK